MVLGDGGGPGGLWIGDTVGALMAAAAPPVALPGDGCLDPPELDAAYPGGGDLCC